jgi:hypothetical protein
MPVANLPAIPDKVLKGLLSNMNITATMHTFMGGFVDENGVAINPGPTAAELLRRMLGMGYSNLTDCSIKSFLDVVVNKGIVSKNEPKVHLIIRAALRF